MDKSELLLVAADAVDLSLTNRTRAERAYKHIGEWLGASDSDVSRWHPEVYPQGSIRLGTANNPFGEVEFDVDAVIQLALRSDVSPAAARDAVLRRIREHRDLGARMEVLDKCFRIHYVDGFHLDVITAKAGGSEILVATATSWLDSAPKAFARWFDIQSAQVVSKARAFAAVEPLPTGVPVHGKPRLKAGVQLMKRRRDVYYDNDPSAPASMLLTAVAGYGYFGDQDLNSILRSITAVLRKLCRDEIPDVPNPVNPSENLARGLIDSEARADLSAFVGETESLLTQYSAAEGLDEIHAALAALLGSGPAAAAISAADEVTPLRQSGRLRFSPSVGLGSEGVLVRPHAFHGT